MSAFSTVGDVFLDPEFSAPGNSFLWGLGASEEQIRERLGFFIMPKRPYEWRVDSHGCYKYDNVALGLGPRDQTAHFPVLHHLRTTNLLGPDSIMRSEHAQQRRIEHRHHRHERILAPLSGITLTTRVIRSQHYTLFNSYKLVRPHRLLCRCRPQHESHMVQRLPVLCPAHRSHSVLPIHRFRWAQPALPQVTFCQLRSLMLPRSSPLLHSWSVASLLVLLRRPSYQSPTHLWMPLRRFFHTPLPLGTLPRNSHSGCSWLHLLRMMFSALRVLDQSPLYFLMRLCRHLYTASQLMMPPHNYRSRSSSSGASYPMTLLTVKHCHRHIFNAGSASPPQPPDIATHCSPSSASHASDGHEHTTAPHVSLQPPLGLEKYARQHASHGIPVKAAAVRLRLSTSISVTPPQPHVSTTQVGTHPVRSATTYKRSASTALAGTHNPVGADPRAGTGPFPKPRALVLPMVKFGQSKPDGLGFIDTVDSDLIHHQYRLSVLQWNPGPARRNPPISSRRLVESSMRLFFKKPVIMSRTSLISSLRVHWQHGLRHLAQQGHLRARPYGFRLQGKLHKQRYVEYGPTHRSRPTATPFTFWNTDSHILLCAHPQCRFQET